MEFIVLFFIVLAFILACYEDIKKKEIYDYLNFSLLFSILIIATIDSIINGTFIPLKYVGFGMVIGFALGALLYFLGIWGGGDAKFLIGFGAGSYYLYPLTNDLLSSQITIHIINSLSSFFQIIIKSIDELLIGINLILIVYISYFLIKKNEFSIIKNALMQLILFILFTVGLWFITSPFTLFIIGILASTIIFFGDEYFFYSVFFLKKKSLKALKEKEIPYNDISKKLSTHQTKYGISKEQLLTIKKLKDKTILIRKIIPTAIVVIANFIVLVFAILSVDMTNMKIVGFLLKVLFASFIAGGLFIFAMMGYYIIKNTQKVFSIFSLYEKIGFILLLFFIIIGLGTTLIITYLALLPILYYFIKTAKSLEQEMFVKKRSIENITLGDWIMQDIKIGNKVYFTKEDFNLGVNQYQLDKIKSLAKSHNNLKELIIKDGIAFLPPIFIGFIIVMVI